MYEYRIYAYLRDLQIPPGTPARDLMDMRLRATEQLINQLASQGWRVVSWDFENYRLLLERAVDSIRPVAEHPQTPRDNFYPPQY